MSGGGFFGGGGSQNDYGSQGAVKRTPYRTVRALMINQVHRATLETPDGPILVDENEVDDVVLCVAFLHTKEDTVRSVTVSDSTGVMDCKLRPNVEVTEEMLNHYNNVFGRFRVFQGKIMFDINRIDISIPPLQHLYHEVEAAREWFHYSGNLPLGQSLDSKDSVKHESNSAAHNAEKLERDESLFVQDSELSTELRGLITDAIDSLSEETEATVPLIASTIDKSENITKKFLDLLEADGAIYTASAGVYQVS